MKVPKEIQEVIKVAGESFRIARENEKIVKDWLDSKGFEENDTVADQFIDCIECGSNCPDLFIEFLKDYCSPIKKN
ncbi:hypothetical protein P4645_15555 [Lysinibacillus fusiformis]|uniref:hypothetical protein n=1 Tax=Lysinibacillus fusiformis TaxID=28031 RepID=UPI002E22128E|nr:hypothetical protein [Lysinibacillus fusiformis]